MFSKSYDFIQGDSPLLVSMPHSGLQLTPQVANTLVPEALALPDTDWHIPKLYDFLGSMNVSVLQANYSRYVIDLNRPKAITKVVLREVRRWLNHTDCVIDTRHRERLTTDPSVRELRVVLSRSPLIFGLVDDRPWVWRRDREGVVHKMRRHRLEMPHQKRPITLGDAHLEVLRVRVRILTRLQLEHVSHAQLVVETASHSLLVLRRQARRIN